MAPYTQCLPEMVQKKNVQKHRGVHGTPADRTHTRNKQEKLGSIQTMRACSH